jgi:hypothetical protein
MSVTTAMSCLLREPKGHECSNGRRDVRRVEYKIPIEGNIDLSGSRQSTKC